MNLFASARVSTAMRRVVTSLALGSLLLLACCASASAAIRFAAPGGAGADPCADPQHPCSLFTASQREVPGTTIGVGDEVVVAPGEYSTAAGDMGPNGSIELPEGVTMHGEVGQPRPVIDFGTTGSQLTVGLRDTISHLELRGEATQLKNPLFVVGGTVEDVIARSSGSDFVCNIIAGTLRNTVCLSSGPGAAAIGDGFVSSRGLPLTVQLRNVTAVATGTGSAGLRYTVLGSDTPPTFELDGKGVIAHGVQDDVFAEAGSLTPAKPGSGAIVKFQLDHSDYANPRVRSQAGGTATISPTGPGTTNITNEPLLANDGYHERPGSPTIDKGATDSLSSAVDIDGDPRKIGLAPDIGADEFGKPSSTTVHCTPSSLPLGAPSSCEVTVRHPAAPETPLTGFVDFLSDPAGRFAPTSCELETSAAESSCKVSLTPLQAGISGVTASYRGTPFFAPSQAEATLTVLAHATHTTLLCTPSDLALGGSGASCTATVADVSTFAATPTGKVKLSSDGPGSFADGGACTLTGANGMASCSLTYVPRAAGPGIQRLAASYSGDPSHEASDGTSMVRILTGSKSTTPNTTLKRRPRKKTARRRAVFVFASDQAGSAFQCKLDRKPFKACRSPFKARVKPGKHTFLVQAVSPQGVADPTPARFRWRVIR
jgi:hypothetical protein